MTDKTYGPPNYASSVTYVHLSADYVAKIYVLKQIDGHSWNKVYLTEVKERS